jgi:hypothetical protein
MWHSRDSSADASRQCKYKNSTWGRAAQRVGTTHKPETRRRLAGAAGRCCHKGSSGPALRETGVWSSCMADPYQIGVRHVGILLLDGTQDAQRDGQTWGPREGRAGWRHVRGVMRCGAGLPGQQFLEALAPIDWHPHSLLRAKASRRTGPGTVGLCDQL